MVPRRDDSFERSPFEVHRSFTAASRLGQVMATLQLHVDHFHAFATLVLQRMRLL
jgi:hypothetical protein